MDKSDSPRDPAEAEANERIEARLLRRDAALGRSSAGIQRAGAARQRAEAARNRAESARRRAEELLAAFLEAHEPSRAATELPGSSQEHVAVERERVADTRESEADERERVADTRESEADERERVADTRESEADERERVADIRESEADERERILASRMAPRPDTADEAEQNLEAPRARAADIAEWMADEAEAYATYLEGSPTRGDLGRRMRIAETEREIARVERRNAARLREPGARYRRLEHLPRLGGGQGEDAPLEEDDDSAR